MTSVRKLVPLPSGPGKDEKEPEDEVHLTLWDHLQDLRRRIIYSLYAVVGGVAVCYYFTDRIFRWLMQPLLDALAAADPNSCVPPLACDNPAALIFRSPTAPLFVYIRVACYAGVFVAAPVILYQLYCFVAPGLYRRERRILVPFVAIGSVFFAGGGLFARYIIMPFAFDVLIGQYVSPIVKPLLDMSECLDLVLMLVIAFGVIFELPLILTLLARIGIVSSAFLSKWRRHAIVANTIIAAVVTPTGDPFNLALMAIPLIVFYELGIIGARFAEKSRAQAEQLPGNPHEPARHW